MEGAHELSKQMRIIVFALALIGIAVRAYTIANLPVSAYAGSDYPIFYAGGQLVGTPQLYQSSAVDAIQLREVGYNQPPAQFIRLPFFAVWMIPWAKIPFWTSFALWRAATLLSVGIFIWLWPVPREWSLAACAWSLPLAFTITNGQDSGFLLLWLAVVLLFLSRGQEFAAGLALSMCAPKFHLFLLAPLLLVGRRKMLLAMGVVAALLLAISYAVQGPNWPAEFLRAIHDPSVNPDPNRFFNLWGVAHGNTKLEILLAIPVIAATWYAVRHSDLQYGLAAIIAGSFLLCHHETVSDVLLMIPVALLLAFHPIARYTKVIAIFLASPIAYFMIQSPGAREVPRLMLFGMVLLMAWEAQPARARKPIAAAEGSFANT